jgi:membrane fusion protein, copper/silver efflux system
MDQLSPLRPETRERERSGPGALYRFTIAIFGVAALAAALAGGYRLGHSEWPIPTWVPAEVAMLLRGKPATTAPTGAVIYYRDPDGKPAYSAEPRKTREGRDYSPVRASEDVSFEEKPAHEGHGASPEAVPPAGVKKILYYRNPMGLPDTSPVPKKDSMGMDYIPVYEGETDDGATIKVSPGKLQRTGVRSEPVRRHVISRPVRAPGSVQLDERRVSVVSLRSEGFLEKVENVTTGDRVRAGQPLMRVYSPEISAAAAQYLSVVAGPAGSTQLLSDGARRRLENLNVPSDVMAEIERTRKVPRTIIWPAPRDGVVLERTAIDGMRAATGDVLFRIADLSTVWVLVDVPEHELGSIRPRQSVLIRAHALPGRSFAGKVGLIYSQVNKDTRTTRVRVEIPNSDAALLPDMYADVDIATGSGTPVVAVVEGALIETGTRQILIIDKGDGRFEPRQVKVGARGQGFVEITEGIAEGDRVVVAANFLIDAESNLKAALRGLTSGDPQK